MSKDNPLTVLSIAMADAVEKAGTATVLVNARRRIPASGIALKKDFILTANHVVEVDEGIQVLLPDGTEAEAKLVGRDPGSDLALLKLEKGEAAPAETNGEPRIGELVLALGRPTTGGIQASLGIVSAMGGAIRTRRGGLVEGHIRTDAIPYPGFSGGPLVDADGKVIGINTSGLGHGNSLAIPIEVAKKIADQLEKHGSIKRGFLGIRSQQVDVPEKALKREQATGLLVIQMDEGGPATEAGILVGDIIVGINGEAVETHDELLAALTGDTVGNETPVEVLRGGKPETIKVKVAEREDIPHRGRRRDPHMMMFGMQGHHGDFRRRGKRPKVKRRRPKKGNPSRRREDDR
jgi:S1-C subfamily serine protease